MTLKTVLIALFVSAFLAAPYARAEVTVDSRGIVWSPADSDVELRVGGRFHYDVVEFDQDKTSLESDNLARRARIYLSGKLPYDLSFKVERDLSPLGHKWKNFLVKYSGLENAKIVIGNQIAPFSLDNLSSSNKIKTIERSLATALVPAYYFGGSYSHYWDNMALSFGVFKDGLEADGRIKGKGAVAGRLIHTPLKTDDDVVHIGVSAEYHRLDDDKSTSLSSRPEVKITNVKLVDTGSINNVDASIGGGLEAAWAHKNLLLQGEYIRRNLRRSPGSNLDFNGFYVQGAWALTGEKQKYSRRNGVFSLKPKSKFGALELVGRVSQIDLDDEDISGGKQTDLTVGANWYINNNARIMANYIAMDVDRNLPGLDETPSAFLMRFQIAF